MSHDQGRAVLEVLASRECEKFHTYGLRAESGKAPSEKCQKDPCLVCRGRLALRAPAPPRAEGDRELARIRDATLKMKCLVSGHLCMSSREQWEACGCANCGIFRLIWRDA